MPKLCVICSTKIASTNPTWTCSENCAEVLEDRKRANTAEEAEIAEFQESAQFEFGTSEAEKARRALSGLNDQPEPGKALYRSEPSKSGLLELVQAAKVAAEIWNVTGQNEVRKRSAELALDCLRGARSMLTPTVVAGGPDGHGPEVVRLADDVRADGEADDDEAAEAGAPDEGEDPGGHSEDGLGPDSVVVQGDLGDLVPGDSLDDGPAA